MSLAGFVGYVLSYGPHAGEVRPFLVTAQRREARTRMVGLQRPDGQTVYQPQAIEEDVYDGYLFANAGDDWGDGIVHHGAGPVHLLGLSEGSAQQVGNGFLLPAGQQPAQQAAAGGAPSPAPAALTTYAQPTGGQQSQQGVNWLADASRAQQQAQEDARASSTWFAPGSPATPGL